MQTPKAVLLRRHIPAGEDCFRLNTDSLYQIIEEFDETQAREFESLYQEQPEEETEEFFEYEEDNED
jgi:hypothetical protein